MEFLNLKKFFIKKLEEQDASEYGHKFRFDADALKLVIKSEKIDNIFAKNKKTDYFWLQAYVFGKNKKIYIISYIWKSKNKLDNVVDAIKNLKTNK